MGMARPSVHANPEQWERLASYLRRRIDELGWTQEDTMLESSRVNGPSRSVWHIAFGAGQKNGTMAPPSLQGVARTLGWSADSCQRILDGGDPIVAREPVKPSPRQELDAILTVVREIRGRLAGVEGRLDALEARQGRNAGRPTAGGSR